jgi:glycerol-3-phosphate dehydrogenase
MKDYFRTLYFRYGVDADEICAEVHRIHCGEHPDPRAEPIRAEVEYVCRHEMTCTLEDLVERRAGYLYWNPEKRLERLRYGQQVIQEELDLSAETFEGQFTAYAQYLQQFHTLPDHGASDLHVLKGGFNA